MRTTEWGSLLKRYSEHSLKFAEKLLPSYRVVNIIGFRFAPKAQDLATGQRIVVDVSASFFSPMQDSQIVGTAVGYPRAPAAGKAVPGYGDEDQGMKLEGQP